MSALYRRVRPLTFAEVVGQEHVKEPLARAIREGRLAQAYLFSGPRGVGKTTTARLLAMAVGCQGEEAPCGVCPHCRAVQRGAHPDVVEIDAASNNSVEDVRELRERIQLAPLAAPRRVFILDEAHMLSKSAFNALLKTLEEPPPHVLFVFATTEPERMPPTVLSRTQHYRFRRLTEKEIAGKLRRILEGLGREAEEEALRLLARLADGAMRDAESLLDRLLLLEGPLTREKAEGALGLPPQEALWGLAESLLGGRLGEALEGARRLHGEGFAPRSLVGGLMEVLREALYAAYGLPGRALPAPPEALLHALTSLDEALERLARRSDLLALEAALLEASARAQPPAGTPGLTHPGPPPGGLEAPLPPLGDPREPAPPRAPQNPLGESPPRHPDPEAQAVPPPETDLPARFRSFLEGLRPTLRAFVREARPQVEGGVLMLRFPEDKAFHHKKAAEQKAALMPLAQAHFGVAEIAFVLEKKSPDPSPPASRPVPPEAPLPPPPPWGMAASPAEEEDPQGGVADPGQRLGEIARRLGARLLWVRRPRATEPEEPVSEDEIGGSGI
ncbi:DNA polymerase III subunit gamma/tau [Thermus thermamylovorans]|uniref:DNA polymerase III subunit gamma/tau n=1 Tax=Thermus thermamylovorans TaxID=2509362 RepID=A0A4Q9AZJ1_9DEIN|nr:DNA polymerase III subunit gamma/tau [Thermus thermamylovorans]TBH17601.1 DNA polymerase III subunit gamma/tau [Thermus thermamylovorans]